MLFLARSGRPEKPTVRTRAYFAVGAAIVAGGIFAWLPSLRGQKTLPPLFVPQHLNADPYFSPGNKHKVEVADPLLANQITRMGGVLVADYGSSKLLRVNGGLYQQVLSSRKDAISRDEYNRILMNTGAVDTSEAASDPPSPADDLMRLIQFEGPITKDWYEALQKTRVNVVTYIPNNAYLVSGDPASLRAASALEGVQWSGRYGDNFKLDPAMEHRDKALEEARQRELARPNPARAAALASANQDLAMIQLVQNLL